MAVGNAVILCDQTGLGPMVNSGEVAELRKWNFGMRLLQSPITPMRILAELNRYDANDARLVSDYIREHSTATRLIPEYSSLYEKVMTIPFIVTSNDLTEYHRQMIQKTMVFESQLYWMRRSFPMEPLTTSASTQISLTKAKISAPLLDGHLWVQCEVTNRTSQRLGSHHPAPIYLSYHWFDADGNVAIFEGLRAPLIPPLAPGSSGIYELKIAAPRDPGEYRLRITLVQEGVRWFDELPGDAGFQDIWLHVP
jgi:hypothetical protein